MRELAQQGGVIVEPPDREVAAVAEPAAEDAGGVVVIPLQALVRVRPTAYLAVRRGGPAGLQFELLDFVDVPPSVVALLAVGEPPREAAGDDVEFFYWLFNLALRADFCCYDFLSAI